MNAHSLRSLWLVSIGLAALLLLDGCATGPVTGRRELNLVSAGQELQLGLTSFDQLKTNTPISHDRKQESEADHIGLVYLARAGYDPRAAVAFWERFSAYN